MTARTAAVSGVLTSKQAAAEVITFAFQPVVHAKTRQVIAYEALVRGPAQESAAQLFGKIARSDLDLFDQRCRIAAIGLSVRLGIKCSLNINMLANSRFSPETRIRGTVEAANRGGIPLESIVLEVAEGQIIKDRAEFARMVNLYRGMGFKVAIDDFGAGYAGLNLLADFQPDQIKADKALVSNVHNRGPRQVILRALIQVCRDLGIDLIAEGVETEEEYAWLDNEGVTLFQGYLFGRPAFEALAQPHYPELRPRAKTR